MKKEPCDIQTPVVEKRAVRARSDCPYSHFLRCLAFWLYQTVRVQPHSWYKIMAEQGAMTTLSEQAFPSFLN